MARDHKRNLIRRGDLVVFFNPDFRLKTPIFNNIYAVIGIKANKIQLISPDNPTNSFWVFDNTVLRFE